MTDSTWVYFYKIECDTFSTRIHSCRCACDPSVHAVSWALSRTHERTLASEFPLWRIMVSVHTLYDVTMNKQTGNQFCRSVSVEGIRLASKSGPLYAMLVAYGFRCSPHIKYALVLCCRHGLPLIADAHTSVNRNNNFVSLASFDRPSNRSTDCIYIWPIVLFLYFLYRFSV